LEIFREWEHAEHSKIFTSKFCRSSDHFRKRGLISFRLTRRLQTLLYGSFENYKLEEPLAAGVNTSYSFQKMGLVASASGKLL